MKLRTGTLAVNLLLAISARGEAYGLELIEDARAAGHRWFLEARVYPTLRRLARLGFLSTRETAPLPERDGRPRVYYSLSHWGRWVVEGTSVGPPTAINCRCVAVPLESEGEL